MPKKSGDHIRHAMSRLAGLQELEAKTLYASALQWLYAKYRWLFLLQKDIIVTEAPYTDGTVAVTNGSAAVVGSGTAWSAAWANRRTVIEGVATVFDLAVSGAGAATLQAGGVNVNWPGDTGAGLTYRIFRDLYTLSSDCDWGREYFWWDPQQNQPLPMIGTSQMLQEKALVPGTLGMPTAVARAPLQQSSATSVPQNAVEFGPYAPDGVYSYDMWFFRKPAVTGSDNDYPLWPEEYEDLIVERMEIEYCNSPRHRVVISPLWLDEHRRKLWECMKRNDGGAELTRVRQVYQGRGGREAFSNARVFPDTSGPMISG